MKAKTIPILGGNLYFIFFRQRLATTQMRRKPDNFLHGNNKIAPKWRDWHQYDDCPGMTKSTAAFSTLQQLHSGGERLYLL